MCEKDVSLSRCDKRFQCKNLQVVSFAKHQPEPKGAGENHVSDKRFLWTTEFRTVVIEPHNGNKYGQDNGVKF